jgi:hypothetical protein
MGGIVETKNLKHVFIPFRSVFIGVCKSVDVTIYFIMKCHLALCFCAV